MKSDTYQRMKKKHYIVTWENGIKKLLLNLNIHKASGPDENLYKIIEEKNLLKYILAPIFKTPSTKVHLYNLIGKMHMKFQY